MGYFKFAKVQLESILNLLPDIDFVKYLKTLVQKNLRNIFFDYIKKPVLAARSQHRNSFGNK